MKGQVSRISQDRTKRYSAVFQNQGAMVTDADLGEASFIARSRTDELGNEAVGGGAPADGGAVAVTFASPNYLAALRPGLVYADGVRGTVRLRAGETLGTDAVDLYAKQEDFPQAPARPTSWPPSSGGSSDDQQGAQPGSCSSMAATSLGSSGATMGEKRATTSPSGEIRNFSKFQRMSPV